MKIDEIGLEVAFTATKTAAAFWRAVGFEPADRFLCQRKLGQTIVGKSGALISQTS